MTITREELESLRRASESAISRGFEEREVMSGLEERERRLAEREATYRSAVRDRELAVALAGRPLLAGAAAQLLKLWRDEFDVREEDGRYEVTSRDGRSVSKAVEDWLSSPEYAHFCPPTTRGGTATAGAVAGRPGSSGGESTPRTLGEMLLRRWQESGARPAPGTAPVGLKRRMR